MSNHTPEPWVAFKVPSDRLSRWVVLEQNSAGTGKMVIAENIRTEANARRIVACVNACAGVPDGLLHSGAYREMIQAQTELTIQRDELLAALEATERGLSAIEENYQRVEGLGFESLAAGTAFAAMRTARDLINSIKGGAA